MKIFRYDSIDSTNSECFRRFGQGENLPFGVVAKTQTHGRGQLGRHWYSADAQNLYLSFSFLPKRTPQQFQNFSLIVAKCLAENLSQKLNLALEVKIPNDIYCMGKKVCGVLTESRIANDRITLAVVGIGLNVSGNIEKFPQELQKIATTLSACRGKITSLDEIEAQVISEIQRLISFPY